MSIDLREVQKLNASIQLLLKAHNRSDEDDHADAIRYLFERQDALLSVWSPAKLNESSDDLEKLCASRLAPVIRKEPKLTTWKSASGQTYYEVSDTGFLRWKKAPAYAKCRDYPVTQSTMYRWKGHDPSPSPRPRAGGSKLPYSVVKLYQSGLKDNPDDWYFVDVLVLETFVSKRPPYAMPVHKNGNTLDNSLANLKWSSSPVVTPKQNKNCEVRQRNQKLSDADVSEIKLQLRQGVRVPLIACMYNVTSSTIYAIGRGVTRGHIS